MRFQQLSSNLLSGASCSNYYDYEYEIETCRGETTLRSVLRLRV
jgi:hypothetical protein